MDPADQFILATYCTEHMHKDICSNRYKQFTLQHPSDNEVPRSQQEVVLEVLSPQEYVWTDLAVTSNSDQVLLYVYQKYVLFSFETEHFLKLKALCHEVILQELIRETLHHVVLMVVLLEEFLLSWTETYCVADDILYSGCYLGDLYITVWQTVCHLEHTCEHLKHKNVF